MSVWSFMQYLLTASILGIFFRLFLSKLQLAKVVLFAIVLLAYYKSIVNTVQHEASENDFLHNT